MTFICCKMVFCNIHVRELILSVIEPLQSILTVILSKYFTFTVWSDESFTKTHHWTNVSVWPVSLCKMISHTDQHLAWELSYISRYYKSESYLSVLQSGVGVQKVWQQIVGSCLSNTLYIHTYIRTYIRTSATSLRLVVHRLEQNKELKSG